MDDQPTFRAIVRALWPVISSRDKRQLNRMGRVRSDFMRVVFSRASDAEATDAIRDAVASDPRGAEATLRYVVQAREFSNEYITDRAYRVLVAAMNGTQPELVAQGQVALFERQRKLGWMPLEQAFDELCSICPQLDTVRQRAVQLSDSDEARAARSTDRLLVPGSLLTEALGDAKRLIGPESDNPDPLLRSSFVRELVSNSAAAVLAGPDARTTERPMWDRHGARAHVVFTSRSFSSPDATNPRAQT